MTDQTQKRIVFVGRHTLTSTLPFSEVDEETKKLKGIDFLGFEAVRTFDCLKELQYPGELTFTYAQALIVTPVKYGDVRHWERGYSDFRGYVFVAQRAVDWLLCFPVEQRQDGQYVPWKRRLSPDDDDVFYTFSSAAPSGAPIHPVLYLDDLRLLSPQPGDKWAEAIAEMGLGTEEIAEVARARGAEVVRMGTDYMTLAWAKQRVRIRVRTPAEKKEKKEVAVEEQKKKWQKALEKLARENQERYGLKGEKNKEKKKMEEREVAEPVMPAPAGIACEGCRHGVQRVKILDRGREVWWYCRLLHGWMWTGDPEEGYPEECSAWEQAQELEG